MHKKLSALGLKTVVLSTLLPITFSPSVFAQIKIAQAPLGEQIEQDRSKIREDRNRVRREQADESQGEQGTQQYIDKTQEWVQQADAQAQTVQSKLNSLERGKSQATLAKMLNTPGNELYVLNTWLRNEAAQKAQAEANIQNAQRSIVSHRSAIEQNQHQLNSDAATLARDQGTYRDEMDSHADLVRQSHDARWQHDFHGAHRGRFYTQDDQSAYDAGYHQMRNPYWGVRRSGSFSGQ
jgi:hypothetical protein